MGRLDPKRRALASSTLAVLIGLCAQPGSAQVLEIAPDGAMTTYATPMQFTHDGARPLEDAPALKNAAAPTRSDVSRAIAVAAQRHAVSPDLIEAVAWRESRFQQAAVSSAGAVGVMQLMAGTARDLGVDRNDLDQNVSGGAAYLSAMLARYGGDLTLALAAYNAGPGAVDRHRGVPPFRETQAYVAAVLTRLSQRALATPTLTLAGN